MRPWHACGQWVREAALVRPLVVASLLLLAALPAKLKAQEVDCDTKDDKRVRALRFQGNTTFTGDQLSAIVLTTPSSFTRRYFHWFFGAGAERCLPDSDWVRTSST